MSGGSELKLPEGCRVYISKLESGSVSLLVTDEPEALEPFCQELAKTSSCTPLRADQVGKGLAMEPVCLLVRARDMVSLVNLSDRIQPAMPTISNFVVILQSYDESDVLELMNHGVRAVLAEEEDPTLALTAFRNAAKEAFERREQASELAGIRDTANTAIKAASEIGMLLLFLQKTSHLTEIQPVMRAAVGLIRSLGLSGCVSCHFAGREHVLGTEEEISPIQLTLVRSLTERIVQKGRILGLSSETSAWVCSGGALSDESYSGRLRDILIQAVDILDAKIRSLEVINLIRDQHEQLFGVIELLQRSQKDSQAATQQIMKRLAADIEIAAVSLDLNEEQESHLLGLSNKAHDQLDQLFAGFNLLENHFSSVLEGLEKARRLADAHYAEEGSEATSDSGASSDDDNIQLF